MKNDNKQKKNIKSAVITALFLAFIIAGCILYIFLPKSDYSPAEKRYLSGFPEVSVKNIKSGKFSEDFEKFLADQTPLRTFFVSVNSYFELIKGNNGSNGVYLGKNGWLIEKPFDSNNRFDKNLKEITDFARESSLPVTLIAVPEKGALLKNYLPKNSLQYHDFEYIEQLNKEFSGIDNALFVNLTQPFSGMENRAYYYRTDHHWTSNGAYAAYREFCRLKGFAAPSLADYDVTSYPGFYGTSYSTSCYTLTKPDDISLFVNSQIDSKVKVTIAEGKKTTESSSMFFTPRLDEEDKYTVFLDGNHTRVDIRSGINSKKLLLIKDSFAHCLAPFLAEQYGEITMIDQRYYTGNIKNLIDSESFDEVMLVYGVDGIATSRDITLN
jgi:hypothetical protein